MPTITQPQLTIERLTAMVAEYDAKQLSPAAILVSAKQQRDLAQEFVAGVPIRVHAEVPYGKCRIQCDRVKDGA